MNTLHNVSIYCKYFWQISWPSSDSKSNLSKLLWRSWLEQTTVCYNCENRLDNLNYSMSVSGRDGAVDARIWVDD